MIELGLAGLVVAFAAGLVSFSSPCVLPLVPGYLSFVSGIGFDELGSCPRWVVASTGAFVAGFSAMFIAFAAGAAWFGRALLENRRPLEIAAGIFIIVAAIAVLGLPMPRLLAQERRFHVRQGGRGLLTSGATGVAFAIGWTPCVGPTLAAILTLSAGGSSATEGATCWGPTRSASGSPSSSSGSSSRARSVSCAGCDGTGGRSATARQHSSSPSEPFSSRGISCG